MKYEKIENKYTRKSTRKNSKWILDFTTTKKIDNKQYEKIIKAFENVPCYYEKYEESYISLKGIKGKKYITINELVKREVILIPTED